MVSWERCWGGGGGGRSTQPPAATQVLGHLGEQDRGSPNFQDCGPPQAPLKQKLPVGLFQTP